MFIWAKGVYVLDSIQTTTLSDIAYQNAREGGLCVYGARVMLDINLDDAQEEGGNRYSSFVDHSVQQGVIIKIYPNPAVNLINIETSEIGILEIFDVAQKKIFSKEIINQKESINLNQLTSGSYFYHFVTVDKSSHQGKLIIIK